jgi:Fic family protein
MPLRHCEGGFVAGRSILLEALLRGVRAEFLEMPGLKLTIAQAQRLWGIDRATCEAAIEELTACRFLARTRDGAFVLRAAMM